MTNDQLLNLLRTLPRSRIPIYPSIGSKPTPPEWLATDDNPIEHELVRIMGGVSVSDVFSSETEIRNAARLCRRASTTVALPGIAVYAKFAREFGLGLPPTDTGPTWTLACDNFERNLTRIRDLVADENKALGPDARVRAVILDDERSDIRHAPDPLAEDWNLAIDRMHQAYFDIATTTFPGCRVHWYPRGYILGEAGHRWSEFIEPTVTRWVPNAGWTFRESGEFSAELYQLHDWERTKSTLRQTVAFAARHRQTHITAFVALGAGYVDHEWTDPLVYDTELSWETGRDIATLRGPGRKFGHAVDTVVLYPFPCGGWDHFALFIRGLAGVKA